MGKAECTERYLGECKSTQDRAQCAAGQVEQLEPEDEDIKLKVVRNLDSTSASRRGA